jgi:hypothetical protein
VLLPEVPTPKEAAVDELRRKEDACFAISEKSTLQADAPEQTHEARVAAQRFD